MTLMRVIKKIKALHIIIRLSVKKIIYQMKAAHIKKENSKIFRKSASFLMIHWNQKQKHNHISNPTKGEKHFYKM
jgi:hypothetical protein